VAGRVKAAVLHAPGTPLRVEDLTLADPRARELLVRVEAAGVCHSDYHYMTGDLTCPLPVVVGHEGAGVVEAVGSGVESLQPGARVAMLWRPRCGRCAYCVAGQPVMCDLGRVQAATGGLPDDGTTRLRRDGGEEVHHLMGVSCFAERAVVSEKSVVKISDGVPSEIAAITGCAVITGVGAVLNVVGECAGRTLLVVGAGGVGLCAVLGARLAGAEPIIVVDVEPARLELAQRLGATCVVEGGPGAVDAVLAAAPGGVEWAIEAVGRADTLQQSIACLRPGGTAVAVGLGRAGATFEVPINELVQRQKRVVGSLYGSANPVLDLPRLWRLYLAGRLPLDALLGERYPLDSVNEAYAALLAGAVGRAVVVP
jgi:S-(hydroxymethyl)glutathione dehydrogenase/alcohol dehydrogenase